MAHIGRRLGIMGLTLMTMAGILGVATPDAKAQPVETYPSAAATGFQHLGLMYHNPERTPADLSSWIAQHSAGVPVANRWMFDAFLMLDLTAPSGRLTDTGATNAADWTALLDRWLGTPGTQRGGTVGQLDTAITTLSTTRSTSGAPMGMPPTRRKIVVTIPWPSDQLASFGMVNGRPRDLRIAADRDAVTAWHLDSIKARFATAGYRNVDLWGAYPMREDVLPTDEAWMRNTTAAAHGKGLKVAWIPYFMAPGWDKWRGLGLDVAIMQPSYAFRSPVDGGPVSASRIAHTAQLAASKGLGVEVEARTAAGTVPEAAMFGQYLAEGVRLGFRDAATAYFLGASRRPAMRDDSYTNLANYLAGAAVTQVDAAPAFTWTTNGTVRTAQAAVAARGDLDAIRVDLATGLHGTWRGQVTVSLQTGSLWQPSGWSNAQGADTPAGDVQSILVPLQSRTGVTGIRVAFTPLPGAPAMTVTRIVADPVWPTANPSIAVGAQYTVSAAPATTARGQYPDNTPATTTGFGSGLLNDGQWATGGWWNAQPIGWGLLAPVRVVFDLGAVKAIDRVELRTHGGADATVNWPIEPTLSIGKDCMVLAASGRGPAPDCAAVTVPGSNPQITGTEGAHLTAHGGFITFTPPAGAIGRYATLTAQSTGWLLADEVRFFSGGVDVTSTVRYRLLTSPGSDLTADGYADTGVALTDGSVAPLMNGHGVTAWNAAVASDVVVDLGRVRSVGTATTWVIDDNSTGTLPPPSVTISTSVDGVTWTVLGRATTASRAWLVSTSMIVTGPARAARYVKHTIAADPANPQAWHAVSEVEATP